MPRARERWWVAMVLLFAGARVFAAPPVCGDGVVAGAEECDDGNPFDDDGCSPFCTRVAGRYGVGVVDVQFTYFSALLGTDRTVPVRVWYPAASPPPTRTTLDAPPHEVPAAAGPLPLLIESHGYGAPSFESTLVNPRAYFLARNGYILAAPFHPDDLTIAFATLFAVRPEDARVVLDRLLDPATAPAVVRGHIDPDRVGATGQSLGGVTATALTVNGFFGSVRDPRVKAVLGTAAEDYVFSAAQLATSRVPIMLLIGDLDWYFTGPDQIRATYANLQAPRFLVEIPDADHGTPLDSGGCPLPYCSHRAALRYPLAFFDAYLRNDRSAAALLAPGAEAEFGPVRYFRDPGPALSLGGRGATDCMVALASSPGDALDDTPLRTLTCTDGTACDADPAPGRCEFDVRLCVNVVDPRTIACVPTDVASLRVVKAGRSRQLAALQAAATALGATSDRRCTATVRLTVATRRHGKGGRRKIRLRARDAAGRQDVDTYVLRCRGP
jgi:cysteine-rich repeat protein